MQRSKGFTLIELILVIVILGIIAVAGSLLLQQGLNNYFTNQAITDASWQGQIALQTMARRLREIRSPTDITTASATQLSFTDINNNAVSYQLIGSNLLLNGSVLISGVNNASSSFAYLDSNTTTTAVLANIRYITINLAIAKNNVNYTLRTTIYARNLL